MFTIIAMLEIELVALEKCKADGGKCVCLEKYQQEFDVHKAKGKLHTRLNMDTD